MPSHLVPEAEVANKICVDQRGAGQCHLGSLLVIECLFHPLPAILIYNIDLPPILAHLMRYLV